VHDHAVSARRGAAADGPYFDELVIGQEFGGAPGLTLTSGLAAAHQASIGDRLALATDHELCREVTNQSRTGRAPTGLAVLRITTMDQEQRPVLDFWRCAMLPLRDHDRQTGHADELSSVGQPADARDPADLIGGWRLDRFARRAAGPRPAELHAGLVHEGDTLRSTISVERVDPLPGGGGLVHLRSLVRAEAPEGSAPRDVLDWRYIGVVA
jgi:acyl dehydratase